LISTVTFAFLVQECWVLRKAVECPLVPIQQIQIWTDCLKILCNETMSTQEIWRSERAEWQSSLVKPDTSCVHVCVYVW
jgi:hypothetical protein